MDEAEAMETEPAGVPSLIVFEAGTARRVGAQLRAGGGPHLDKVRYAVYCLTAAVGPEESPDNPTPSRA
ncbi:hypothetical protein JNW90_01285 [Micromonospora sp. STR1s_5]|nr:hypothetical protein [Micromonospora sp. STR1s_5]